MEWLAFAMTKLEQAGICFELDDYDKKQLAKNQGAVFICNQLLPGLDEWLMVALLSAHYEAVRILHPYAAPPSKSLRPLALRTRKLNLQTGLLSLNIAKKVMRQTKKGAAVAFAIDFSDNPLGGFGKNLLRTQILKEIRKSGCPIVPVHLEADHLPGGLLRRAIPGLPYLRPETPIRINVRVGNAVTPEEVDMFRKSRMWTRFLQAKIFSLGTRFDLRPESMVENKPNHIEPLAEPIEQEILEKGIAALADQYKITARGPFDVYVAPLSALNHVMSEIGRLREYTFRAVGEGTGRARDMDEYDMYYLQLVIWDREAKKIVGGYRLGQGDEVFQRYGVNGFYIHSLFKIKSGLFPVLQQAIELGRSYVVPEYQRHRLPLFLLWKGILHFLLANPRYRYLIGPVSISKDYSDASKAVIVDFVQRYFFDLALARYVQPRKPFRPKLKAVDAALLAESLHGEFEALEDLIETMEPAHFKVPVLFRQYLKQNAKFISFNVDPNFADCLDGLMVLDIRYLPDSTIEALQQEK